MVLVAKMLLTILVVHLASVSFWASLFLFSAKLMGTDPSLIMALSSLLFRCFGTSTNEASTMEPSLAMIPLALRVSVNKSKGFSVSPFLPSRSLNNQIVLASSILYDNYKFKKSIKERRSFI